MTVPKKYSKSNRVLLFLALFGVLSGGIFLIEDLKRNPLDTKNKSTRDVAYISEAKRDHKGRVLSFAKKTLIATKNNTESTFLFSTTQNTKTKESEAGIMFVASKNGSRYYPTKCSSANRINKENRVFFTTQIGAEKEGYTKAKNC